MNSGMFGQCCRRSKVRRRRGGKRDEMNLELQSKRQVLPLFGFDGEESLILEGVMAV